MSKMSQLHFEIVDRRTQVLIQAGIAPEDAYELALETVGKSESDFKEQFDKLRFSEIPF